MPDSSQSKPTRVSDGNVIYAQFGGRTQVSKPETPKRDTAFKLSPAAARPYRFASARTDQGRITRGRQYAQAGNVVDLDIRNGAAHGQVAGSQNYPFTVTIALPYRNAEDLAEIPRRIAAEPNGISCAREGKLSDGVLDILFGESPSDIRFVCSCPDSTAVCKHVMAVVDKLATKIDADVGVAFNLRGMTLDQVAQSVITRTEGSQETTSEAFWQGRPLPDLPTPKVAPALDDSDLDLLHKAMRQVSFTNVDQLRAVADIEDLYDWLTH